MSQNLGELNQIQSLKSKLWLLVEFLVGFCFKVTTLSIFPKLVFSSNYFGQRVFELKCLCSNLHIS